MTLAELKGNFRLQTKVDPNAKIWNDSAARQFINSAAKKVERDFNYSLRFNQTSATDTIVSGTQAYALPTDFVRMIALRIDEEAPLKLTDVATELETGKDITTGKTNKYYYEGSNVMLSPIPNQGSTLKFQYLKTLGTLSADDDVSGFGDDFSDAIAIYASYLAYSTINRYRAEAQEKLQDYANAIAILKQNYQLQDVQNMTLKQQRY